MSGQQGCRVVGEDMPWQLCVGKCSSLSMVCVGRGLRAIHAYSSFGRIYVEYRYVRAEELMELRRRRMFFREVRDLFRITLAYPVQGKSCWKTMLRWRCFRAVVSSCSSK